MLKSHLHFFPSKLSGFLGNLGNYNTAWWVLTGVRTGVWQSWEGTSSLPCLLRCWPCQSRLSGAVALSMGFPEEDPETRIQRQAITLGEKGNPGKWDRKGSQGRCVVKQVSTVSSWSLITQGNSEAGIKHLGIIPPEEEESWGIYIPSCQSLLYECSQKF